MHLVSPRTFKNNGTSLIQVSLNDVMWKELLDQALQKTSEDLKPNYMSIIMLITAK